jgi:hypothetical protein
VDEGTFETEDPSESGSKPNFIQRAFAFAKDNAGAPLDIVYSAAVGGVNGLGGAEQIGDHYKKGKGSLRERADRLVKRQCFKTGVSGFATGVGGAISSAITIPVGITAALYVQIVMVAAIAHMAGEDVRSDEVKGMVLALIVGDSLAGRAKDAGIKAANNFAKNGVKNIPGAAVKAVNKVARQRLITKFGTEGVVNLGKMIPLAGGLVGGTFDSLATLAIGRSAVKFFIINDAQKNVTP